MKGTVAAAMKGTVVADQIQAEEMREGSKEEIPGEELKEIF